MAKPSDFRTAAARRLNEQREQILDTLLALTKTEGGEATKSDWFPVTCKHCGKAGKYPYTYSYPVGAVKPEIALSAVEKLDKMGFGRPDGQEDHTVSLDKDPETYSKAERTALTETALKLLNPPNPSASG